MVDEMTGQKTEEVVGERRTRINEMEIEEAEVEEEEVEKEGERE
jgi:hypothetical protein